MPNKSLFLSGGTRQGQATEQLIQKLSETYFIRRPAQLTAYFFLKGKDKFLSSNHLQDINKKAIDFKKEVQVITNNDY